MADKAMKLTPAQRRFLTEAADNWLGVAKLHGTSGLGRVARLRMAEDFCSRGLMRRYVTCGAEFQITKEGRCILKDEAALDPRTPAFGVAT